MSKVMKCQDVGLDCSFQAKGETEQEVMQKVADHAKKDHNITDISPELAAKVKSVIRDE